MDFSMKRKGTEKTVGMQQTGTEEVVGTNSCRTDIVSPTTSSVPLSRTRQRARSVHNTALIVSVITIAGLEKDE